jgi:hypothetical protein
MSRNNKNARLHKLAESLPKNRSAAAKARRAQGEARKPGRAAAPNHGKKNSWWQKNITYAEFIKGGGKKPRKSFKEETGVVETAVEV